MSTRIIGIGVVIAALILGLLVVAPMSGTLAYFQRTQVTGNHTLSTWQCSIWQQTTQADFNTDISVNVSTTAIPGSVVLGNDTTFPSVYGMHGNIAGGADNLFSLYNISDNTWVTRAVTLDNVGAGGALSNGDPGNIYAFRGGGTRTFWQYNMSTNVWTAMENTLNPGGSVDAGGALTNNGTGFIYGLRGNVGRQFWRYTISTNSWTTMTSTLANVGAGGALAYTGNGNISALRGNNGGGTGPRTFWQYNISSDSWSAFAITLNNVGAGGALAYISSGSHAGNISAFRGGGTTEFWQYNISSNSWSAFANAPGNVGTGGALAYDGEDYIYAFNGTVTPSFWRYTISTNTWSDAAVADPASNVGAGGSLAYVPASPSVYKRAGNLTSVVNNSGKAGTTWNSLIWNGATTSGVTNITFRVRASDTSFGPTDSSPSWVTAGWPSPVTTGLPSGRYFQWQAILTTTDTSQTPRLDDVSLCYT